MTLLVDGELREGRTMDVRAGANLWRGQGWFETIAVQGGEAYNLGRHLERLRNTLPEALRRDLDADRLLEQLAELVVEDPRTRGSLKVVAWEESGDLRTAAWLKDYEPLSRETYRRGISLDVQLRSHPPRWPLADEKRTSYASVMAEREATSDWDVLYCDLDGRVWETGIANVLWLDGDTLRYPPADGHLLGGTVMDATLKAAASLGFTVEARSERWDQLEAFPWVTNSLVGMVPVRRIAETSYGGEPPPRRWVELRDELLSDRVFPRWHDQELFDGS